MVVLTARVLVQGISGNEKEGAAAPTTSLAAAGPARRKLSHAVFLADSTGEELEQDGRSYNPVVMNYIRRCRSLLPRALCCPPSLPLTSRIHAVTGSRNR